MAENQEEAGKKYFGVTEIATPLPSPYPGLLVLTAGRGPEGLVFGWVPVKVSKFDLERPKKLTYYEDERFLTIKYEPAVACVLKDEVLVCGPEAG